MPTIRVQNVSIIGQAQTVFPLQGNQYEFLPFPARVEFAIVGRSATAVDEVDLVTATVYSGSDILQQRSGITNKSDTTAQSKSAVYPDDFLLDDVAAAGERLSVELNIPGTVAADLLIDTVVKITPL